MKRLMIMVATASIFFSCQNDDQETSEQSIENQEDAIATGNRGCVTHELHEQELQRNPGLALKMNEIEDFSHRALAEGRLVNGQVQIPVVVNVLYNTTAENISLTRIQQQIDILNKDFNGNNSDFSKVPAQFSAIKANIGISFYLSAVNRKYTSRSTWGTNNDMKRAVAGGMNSTTPTSKLNIWVCTIGQGILGYAQFPGGQLATDGIVLDSRHVGLSGTASYPYNLGRTATHEVGHWLNLRHIWGDANCGSDMVDDTPSHNGANYGAPVFPHYSTCYGSPVEMTMNYMDYSDDRAMYMFTTGQKARMTGLFATGGPRAGFALP